MGSMLPLQVHGVILRTPRLKSRSLRIIFTGERLAACNYRVNQMPLDQLGIKLQLHTKHIPGSIHHND